MPVLLNANSEPFTFTPSVRLAGPVERLFTPIWPRYTRLAKKGRASLGAAQSGCPVVGSSQVPIEVADMVY